MGIELGFEDQVVLVTGGGTGLGLAIANAFGRAGAQVAIADISPDNLRAACEQLTASRIRCEGAVLDVRSAASTQQMFDQIEDRLGPPSIVVANAGIYPNTAFLDLTEEEWDRVLDTNLKGVFLTCQAAARAMVRVGRGNIITISSGSAVNAAHGWAHYCASKAGVVMLTKSMAVELGSHNIRVNAILPGYVDVEEGGQHLSLEYKKAARAAPPRGRPSQPDDIANAAVLLASPLADFITGTTLVVDGGGSAGRSSLRPTEG